MGRASLVRGAAAATALALLALGVPGASAEAPEGITHAATMTEETTTFSWDGTTTAGVNVTHFDAALGETCGDSPDTYCDRVLLTVELPLLEGFARRSGTVTVSIGEYTVPVSDFDMFAYTSDETGARGTRTGNSGNNPGDPEQVGFSIRSSADKTVHHLLVEIPYFAAAGSYKGTATFTPGAGSQPIPVAQPAEQPAG